MSTATVFVENYRGELSAEQREALRNPPTRLVGMTFFFIILFYILFANVVLRLRVSTEVQEQIAPISLFIAVVLSIVLALLDTELIKRRIQRQVNNGAGVETLEGVVTWRRGGYAPVAANRRRLKPIDRDTSLFPGPHRFYVLEGTHWLLAAEPLKKMQSLTSDESPNPELLRALAVANGYLRGALPTNRRGQLSPRQRFMLLLRAVGKMLGSTMTLIAVSLLVGGGFAAFIDDQFETSMGTNGLLIGAAIIFLILSPLLLRPLLRSLWEALTGRVIVESGTVQRDDQPGDESETNYFYCYQTYRFPVSQKGYNALVPDQQYVLYITPETETLVNIEPLA